MQYLPHCFKRYPCQKILGHTPELDEVGEEVVLAFQKGFNLKVGAIKRERIETNLTQNEEIECINI